jgi:hypothetical protein
MDIQIARPGLFLVGIYSMFVTLMPHFSLKGGGSIIASFTVSILSESRPSVYNLILSPCNSSLFVKTF